MTNQQRMTVVRVINDAIAQAYNNTDYAEVDTLQSALDTLPKAEENVMDYVTDTFGVYGMFA